MSAYTPYWRRFEAIGQSRLRPAERLVLHVLNGRAGCNEEAFPTQQSLARDCGLSEDSVRRVLRQLRRAGHVEARRRGRANAYRLTIGGSPPSGSANRSSADTVDRTDRSRQTPAEGDRQTRPRVTAPTGRPRPAEHIHQNDPENTPMRPSVGSGNDPTPVSVSAAAPQPCAAGKSVAAGESVAAANFVRIPPQSFEKMRSAEPVFGRFVGAGVLHEGDRLRFLTLWRYIGRRYRAGQVRSPGALLRTVLARRQWPGGDRDEAYAARYDVACRRAAADDA